MRNGIIAISLRITVFVVRARAGEQAVCTEILCVLRTNECYVYTICSLSLSVNYIYVVPDVNFEMQFAVTASIQLSICSNSNSIRFCVLGAFMFGVQVLDFKTHIL